MEFYKRVLKLHHFRNLGRNLPAELLLNSSFEKHGGLVILVGENNVGKSNVLEALKIFNDADVKLCNEKDYFKTYESKEATLSLEEETILDHKTIGFSCVDLKIRSKEVSKGLKELSKTLISYPFCVFVGGFINLIMSYGALDSFLKSYKEKLKLSAFSTKQNRNLLFKELIKHLSANNQLIKVFCQCMREIIEYNAPNKNHKPNQFFIMGKNRQNQLAKIYSHLKEFSKREIKPQDMGDILKKLEELDKFFKTTDFNTKFAPKTEVKDIIEEIDEKYPINENFKQQFEEFESNVKKYDEARKDFERKKESLIREIEYYCKNQKTLEFNDDVLLDNIQQTCKSYIASHVVSDESKDMKYMMCQFYLEKMELLSNSKIRRYQYDDLLKSAKISLWESIKILDNESGARLFPKNLKEIKEKFEDNKGKFKQSESVSEIIRHCRECNPYTAFQGLRNGVNFPLKDRSLDEFVPDMKEYKELKITDNNLKIKLFEDFHSQIFKYWFFQSLFNKIDFNPDIIWHSLETKRELQIKFDKNNDLEIYFSLNKSFVIPEKYLQEINQELLKEIKRSDYPFSKCEYHSDNNMVQLTFSKDDASPLMVEVSLTEIMEYNMQSRIDSLIAKEFNKLLAIAQDSPQDNYQLKIRVRHNNKFFGEKYAPYEIKLEIHDCRKSDNQKPIILSEQSTGFQWAFNFMFGFLYNVGSNFSFNKNIIYVMDEPATHLSVPARKEFRKFLKEYAHKNHVTFVLATHDPFLVDTDHLDEIRIVEKEKQGSVINNGFSYDPKEDASKNSDALYQIKRSLGVGQHVFHNPKKHRIIFVEGITDYCYLSAFKLYFNKHNPQFPFTFLPISGLKNNPKNMEKTIQKLCELDNSPIVLIDDDRKDDSDPQRAKSEQFKNANEEMHDPIKILQLSNYNKNFKQIEDCFSASDRKKYATNKCMELAMAFKTRLLYSGKDDVVSEETKENFKKLFEWIKKECNNPTIKKEYIKFDYNTPQIL
ncbi:ABC transporter ATPase [Helicobacter pylori]|uniref:AAA family ATPase n=1 Tax=Helicobacter pylori TaxID=210 RepID=UPI0006810A74|nr:AAA family ATPase [Helicobacter pylori]KMZ51592.1 ABC transporter ATPase [Helicobacter pylori]